jgi:hypothetical protein
LPGGSHGFGCARQSWRPAHGNWQQDRLGGCQTGVAAIVRPPGGQCRADKWSWRPLRDCQKVATTNMGQVDTFGCHASLYFLLIFICFTCNKTISTPEKVIRRQFQHLKKVFMLFFEKCVTGGGPHLKIHLDN